MSTPDTFTELLREELSPAPDSQFAREMDEWAAAGFPRREREREAQKRPPRARLWLRSPLGMATATSAVAAVAIAAVLVGDSVEQGTNQSSEDALSEPAARDAAPSPTQELSTSDDAGSGGGIAPGESDRRIERAAQLTLAAPSDDFQSVGDQVLKVTDRHEGFVLRSQVSTGDNPTGDFQLRIPADRLQPALRDLSALGDVRARSDTGQDVTREYVSVSDQLAASRAERRALLRRLAAATDDGRAQELRDRLDRNGRELATLRGQIRELRERTNYAAVSVTLVEGKSDDEGGAAGGGTSDALDDSLGLLTGSFNWLLRALGVLIPAGIVAGAAWWTARSIRRRRREAVLS